MKTQTIRHRSNGTIDLDFYRARAVRERAAVRRAMLRAAGRAFRPAVGFAALLAMICAMPAEAPQATDNAPTSVASLMPLAIE